MEEGYKSLLAVAGVDDKLAEKLYDAGYSSSAELAEAEVTELVETGLDQVKAGAIIKAAAAVPAPVETEAGDADDNEGGVEVENGAEVRKDETEGKTDAADTAVDD
jgi:hypothetical protein